MAKKVQSNNSLTRKIMRNMLRNRYGNKGMRSAWAHIQSRKSEAVGTFGTWAAYSLKAQTRGEF